MGHCTGPWAGHHRGGVSNGYLQAEPLTPGRPGRVSLAPRWVLCGRGGVTVGSVPREAPAPAPRPQPWLRASSVVTRTPAVCRPGADSPGARRARACPVCTEDTGAGHVAQARGPHGRHWRWRRVARAPLPCSTIPQLGGTGAYSDRPRGFPPGGTCHTGTRGTQGWGVRRLCQRQCPSTSPGVP